MKTEMTVDFFRNTYAQMPYDDRQNQEPEQLKRHDMIFITRI